MRNCILISESDNFSDYPKKVIVFDTEEDAKQQFNEIETELEISNSKTSSDWYSYATIVDFEVIDKRKDKDGTL